MKLKKLFAGIVAAAMMLTMGATAFADAPAPAEGNKVTITKKYTAANDGTKSGDDEFTFNLTTGAKIGDTTKTVEKSAATAVPNPEVTSYTVKLNTDQGTSSFDIDLTKLNITRPGVYYYTLTEATPEIAGVTAVRSSIIMVVTAGYENEAAEKSETLSYWVALRDSADYNGDKVKGFENSYSAGSLNVKKTVKGNLGDHDTYFTFTVDLTSDHDVSNEIQYSATTKDSNGVEQKGTIEFKKNAAGKYTASVTFELKHNTEFNITNLPYGVSYEVKEDGAGENGTITVGDKTYNVTYEKNTGAIGASNMNASTTITNTCGTTEIDTGVILDNAPYIALLTIVAFGAVALVLNKRRRDEE